MKNRKKLRRVAMLALVLVLLCNTLGVNASTGATKKPPKVTVSDYGSLYTAYAEAEIGDVIGIRGTIVIPTLVSLEKSITFRRMEAGAKLIFRDDTASGSTGKVTYLNFDGNANEVGGLDPFIVVCGNEVFSMCSFTECYYGEGNGGALYVGFGDVTVSSCDFTDNSAVNGSHIYNNGTLTVDYSSFSDGWADDMGGAIYNAGTAYINNSNIKENNARIGGGIYSSSSLEINNSLVWNNTATRQGADLACEGTYVNNTTEEQYTSLLSREGLYYLGWEDDTNPSVGGAGDYLKFLTTDEEPTTPVTPDPEEPTTPEPTDPVTPTDPEPTTPVEPTEPEEPTTPTDPTPTDPVDPEPTEPTEPTTPTDPEPTEPTEPSTPSTEEPSTEPSTEDPKPSTPSDAEQGGSNTDNSQSSSNSTVNNSSSSVSNVDNSSQVSNAHTDNSKSESSKTENSNNSSTVNNYYPQDQTKQGVATASQNTPQPVNVTVPVNVSVPEQKGQNEANTEAQASTSTGSLADKNIKIDAKGVDVVLEITGDTYNISISAPEEAKEEQVQAIATNTTPTASQEPTEANNKPNWVESVCMLLLAVLVGLEVKDRLRKKPE